METESGNQREDSGVSELDYKCRSETEDFEMHDNIDQFPQTVFKADHVFCYSSEEFNSGGRESALSDDSSDEISVSELVPERPKCSNCNPNALRNILLLQVGTRDWTGESTCAGIITDFKRIRLNEEDEGYSEVQVPTVDDISNDSEIVREIFGRDEEGDSLLDIAIICKQTNIAEFFIQCAPSHRWLNTCNARRQTPLHLSVITRQVQLVRRLIVGGAEVDRVDRHGNTPNHLACQLGYYEIVRELVKPVKYEETKKNDYIIPFQRIPQDFDTRNYDGLSCFHLAARNDHLEVMNILLNIDKDILINTRELQSGKTMLHYAADTGNYKLVRFLLRVPSIDVDSVTYDGVTPLEIAHYRGHGQIKSYLLFAGAKETYIRGAEEEL